MSDEKKIESLQKDRRCRAGPSLTLRCALLVWSGFSKSRHHRRFWPLGFTIFPKSAKIDVFLEDLPQRQSRAAKGSGGFRLRLKYAPLLNVIFRGHC